MPPYLGMGLGNAQSAEDPATFPLPTDFRTRLHSEGGLPAFIPH